MAVTFSNELKKFEGLPWSTWTDFIGCVVPPETVENASDNTNSCSRDSSGSMRLNKSDMGIYGQYPGAETFELAVCEFCGDKFKLAALADHIGLRHQDGKKVPALDISSVALSSKAKLLQLHLQKKGKTRYNNNINSNNNNKHKDTNEKAVTISGNRIKAKPAAGTAEKSNIKQSSMNEIDRNDENSPAKVERNIKPEKTDPQSLASLLKQDASKLKNLKLKLRKTKETSVVTSVKVLNSKLGKNSTLINSNSSLVKSKEKQKLETIIKKQIVKTEPIRIQAQLPRTPDNHKLTDAMMQPVVQLSPLAYTEGVVKVPITLHDPKRRLKTEKKIISIKDRTYNPDRHCGVVGKENTKPCTRSLTCKSHSMSLRRAVRGRSKAFDMLLADHRAEKELFKRKLLVNNISAVAVETSEMSINTSPHTSTIILNQKGDSELQKLKNKNNRNAVSDYSRLSLPVSIKNPNIFTPHQNLNDKGINTFSSSIIPNSPPIPSTVRLLGASSILKKQALSPLLSRQESSSSSPSAIYESPPHPGTRYRRHIEVKHWYPGYRRSGGLLYSNNNIPKINGILTSKTDNSIILESIPIQNLPIPVSAIALLQSRTQSNFVQISTTPPQPEFLRRIPASSGTGKKKTVATLIPKQATSLLMPTVTLPGQSLLNNQSQKKTALLQVQSPQVQNGVIYCQNQVGTKRAMNEEVLTVSPKRVKRDTKFNIVGPLISKNGTGNTVMRLSIANGVVEKEIIPNSNSFSSACRTLQPGVSLLQNNGVRLPSDQRVHYVTSSGPVTLQQFPVVPQVQLKQVDLKSRIPPKFKLIAPNVTVTSAGMVFIQKDQRN